MIHSSFDLEISKYTKVKAEKTYICKKILKLRLQNVENTKTTRKIIKISTSKCMEMRSLS